MSTKCIFLASASPRRRELLDQLGVCFEVRPAAVSERVLPQETPQDCAGRLAVAKASAVRSTLAENEVRPILAADTVVAMGDKVLGKPRDRAHAAEILQQLSGRTHEVFTAVVLLDNHAPALQLSCSEVSFRAITLAEIDAYWATGEPVDKAGSYAIQGLGAVFVRELKGSHSGVMGLPLYETALLLEQAGVPYRMKTGAGDE